MIHVIVVGDEKFFADVDKTSVEMPYLLMHSLDDISVFVEGQAREFAPAGETGRLKTLGIGREEAKPEIGFAEGYSSDYITGVESQVPEGDKTYRAVVGLRKEVPYGLFVHEGTVLQGRGIMHASMFTSNGNVFRIEKEGRVFYRRWVHGQKPQPFLKAAVELAKFSYIPIRVKYLAEQIVHPGVG